MDSSGPRYAPEDPTLPKPWKALIDGSSGYMYYWNPDTNITQYERPSSVPPLPSGLPPNVVSAPVAPQTHESAVASGHSPVGASVGHTQQAGATLQQLQQRGQHISHMQQNVAHFPQAQLPGSAIAQAPQPSPQSQQLAHSMSDALQSGMPLSESQKFSAMPNTQVGTPLHQPAVTNSNISQQTGSSSYLVPQSVPPFSQMQRSAPPLSSSQQAGHAPQSVPMLQRLPLVSQMQQPVSGEVHPESYQGGPRLAQVPKTGFSFSQTPHSGTSFSHLQQPFPTLSHQAGGPMSHFQIPGEVSGTSHQVNTSQTQQDGRTFQTLHTGMPPSYMQPVSPSIQMTHAGLDSSRPQFGLDNASIRDAVDNLVRRPQTSISVTPMVPPMHNNHQSGGSTLSFNSRHESEHSGRPNAFAHNTNQSMMMPQQPKVGQVSQLQGHLNVPPGHGPGPDISGGSATLRLHEYGPPNGPIRPPHLIDVMSDASNLSAVEAYKRHHEVTATGDNVPAPFITFEATGFPPEILREIHSAGFSSPTPIQAQTWPIALQGRDIVAIAKTGSGKTLGYLIPAFMHLRRSGNNSQAGPSVLVLAPTRELATQIQDEAIKFGHSSRISCTCLYGGAPKVPQIRELERGADIVIATPGRLNDILEMRKINVRQVSLLVLDEADRMLDMGFEPQIRKVVDEIPSRRQTLMYTATWPKEVRKIAGDLLMNPVQVNIGNVDELAANKAITQHVEMVPQFEKQRRLEQILRAQEQGSKVIIFCSTKRACDQLARSIGRFFRAAAIHGDKSQDQRDRALNDFRSGRSPVLVATDVAARGLDIKDIRVVINYDFPTGVEDYVHRIGRTGRAGATGVAYTFFCDQDSKYAPDLIKVLEGANQRVPPEIRDMAARSGRGARGGHSRWEPDMRDVPGGRGGGGRFGGRGGDGVDFAGGRGGGHGDFMGGRGRGFNDFRGGRGDGFNDSRGGRGDGFNDSRGGRGDGFNDSRGGRGNGFNDFRGGRDGGFNDSRGGRGGRGDMYNGRGGGRVRGFGGSQSGGRGRFDRSPNDRFHGNNGRGRFEGRRDGERSRGRSRSSSPERVRTWGYSRSRSPSRSRSRSWSRGRSRSRSRSWSRGRSRSRSRTPERYERRERSRPSLFDAAPAAANGLPVDPGSIPPIPELPTDSGMPAVIEPGIAPPLQNAVYPHLPPDGVVLDLPPHGGIPSGATPDMGLPPKHFPLDVNPIPPLIDGGPIPGAEMKP